MGNIHWKKKKGGEGFTLIELLVVIAILGVLATAVVLVLNPAELLAQGRDSTRLSDLASLNSALSLYLVDTAGSQSMGTSTVTYLSLPEPGSVTDCSDLGFPAGYFHCSASSTYTKTDGTGWIPVNLQQISSGSPLSKLPVDPINATSSNLYYAYWTNGQTYKVMAFPESQKYLAEAASNSNMFQTGSNMNLGGGSSWVLVPGNSAFGTKNFWVMTYDAGCSDGNGNAVNSPLDGQGYNNGGNSVNSNNCTPANGRQIASIPNAAPVVDISHTQAVSYCASIGAHLLTNDEYMTIVTNAANQGTNWSNGSVGSGVMPRGNSNSGAAQWSGSSQYGTGYSDFTHLRTITLSDGSVVWDMAGNVWEHVQRSVNNTGDLQTTMALPSRSDNGASWNWGEYGGAGTVNNANYINAWSSDVAQAKVGPPQNWNSTENIGQVYTYGTGANQGTTVFIRGGNWGDGSIDGPFSLSLRWGAGSTSGIVGFRCAR